MRSFTFCIVVLSLLPLNAFAEDKCFPVKDIQKIYAKFDKLKPKRLDTLETRLTAHFVDAEKRTLPMSLYINADNQRDDFSISDEGEVLDFHAKTKGLAGTTEICGPANDDNKIGLGMSTDVIFKNQRGPFSLAELKDGIADGKSHYKTMMPGPMAMFVPKMTHVMIAYNPIETEADISAIVKGAETQALPIEVFGGAHVLSVKALEEMGVESLIVKGGTFELSPVPSIEKMKSLGFGPDSPDAD